MIESAFATSSRIYMRFPTEADANGNWHNWLNDPAHQMLLGREVWPNSLSMQLQYLKDMEKDLSRLLLAICDKETHEHIGIASLSGINRFHQSAQTGLIIGSGNHLDGTYAIDSLALLTEIGLIRMNLHRLEASALLINQRSHLLNKVLGWKEVGIRRESHFCNGSFTDSIIYEILRSDWLNSSKRPSCEDLPQGTR